MVERLDPAAALLDDGFPYEEVSDSDTNERDRGHIRDALNAWLPPTPFMILSLKELLAGVVAIYGSDGLAFLQDIDARNDPKFRFLDDITLAGFEDVYVNVIGSLGREDLVRLGVIEC